MKQLLGIFFVLIDFSAALSYAAEPPSISLPPQREKRRLVLCNDGGTLGAPDMEAPIGIEGLVHETIDPLRDTMVDTLYWQLGVDPYFGTTTARLSDWYAHETKVGSVWGADRQQFKTAGEWRIAENIHQIMAGGTDPAAVIIDGGHRAGIDVFLSLRFNDGHDGHLPKGLNDVNMVPMRKQHPEWLLNGTEYSRYVYNFAIPEVRDYEMGLIREAIARYAMDGFDLDFDRQPCIFQPGEEEANAPLITEMLRQTRAALDARGRELGRRLLLSVRVPPSLEYDRHQGLEVPVWIAQRIVDIVVVGDPGGWNYRLPIEDFRALTKGTDCKILAQNLCAYKEDRGRSASVLFGEGNYYSPEQFRAVAARHWMAGADGQFIWNQHFLKFFRDDQFSRQSWKEIGDPQVLARLDKHYLVGPQKHGGCLPLTLAPEAPAQEINVEIADDIAAAKRDGLLKEVTLRVLVEQLTSLDKLEVRFNGHPLDLAKATKHLNYNDCWVDFDVADTVQRGNNALSIQVQERNPHVQAKLTLRHVDTFVRYTRPSLGK